MFINYFTVIEKIMEDPTLAYEVIAGMQPRVRKWKAFLLILFISFFESLALHPLFTISTSLLLILFIVFGVHKRVVAPRIIANRCSTVLSDFCLSCDEQGKLIVRPAYSPAISPMISKQSPTRISTTTMPSPPSSPHSPSSSSPISNLNDENEKNNLLLNNSLNERKTKKEEEKENNIFNLDFTDKNLIQTF
ncbi:unnamed protein product [Meloidogyne enterolobii]|uniref:Uncharacterized protein n=1 Tax=Meloidogyne enterolobii TaxID=390850 RepID=A0ACB0YP95_MELEN